jgi:hypothetical protein
MLSVAARRFASNPNSRIRLRNPALIMEEQLP